MALRREVAGALSHAELVDLVVRQSELIDELRAMIAQQLVGTEHLRANIEAASHGPLPQDVYAEAKRRLDAAREDTRATGGP